MYPANNAPRTFVYASPTYSPANNALYLTTASACETTPFHGQVMRVDVTPGGTPKVRRRWFPNGFSGPDGGGIWGPGGVSIGPYEKAVFAGTGNAIEGQENQLYSEHVVRLDLKSECPCGGWARPWRRIRFRFRLDPDAVSAAGMPTAIGRDE